MLLKFDILFQTQYTKKFWAKNGIFSKKKFFSDILSQTFFVSETTLSIVSGGFYLQGKMFSFRFNFLVFSYFLFIFYLHLHGFLSPPLSHPTKTASLPLSLFLYLTPSSSIPLQKVNAREEKCFSDQLQICAQSVNNSSSNSNNLKS